MTIVVLGDLNVDLSIALPGVDARGVTHPKTEPVVTSGGTAGNTASALGALGAKVSFLGAVGDDAYGSFLVRELHEIGVDTRGVTFLQEHTAQVIALIDPNGERLLYVWPSTGGALSHLMVTQLDEGTLRSAAWLHVSGMCLQWEPIRSTMLAAMRIARSARVPISLDLNLRIETWGLTGAKLAAVQSAVDLADYVLGGGAEELMPLASASDVSSALRIVSGGRRTVVARLGAAGAEALDRKGTRCSAPGISVTVQSLIGAGDAFNGGFIAALTSGLPLHDALRWGNATAALKVQGSPRPRGLPNRADVEELLTQHHESR
jgi:sugar/nucleoside kinase (ribokinase family)